MAVSKGVLDSVADLFGFVPELVVKRMFGGAGVWTAGVMFALIIDDDLFLKTDEQTRPLFEAEGCGPWVYERASRSRDMGYNRAPELIWDDADEARRWAEIAIAAAFRRRGAKAVRLRKLAPGSRA